MVNDLLASRQLRSVSWAAFSECLQVSEWTDEGREGWKGEEGDIVAPAMSDSGTPRVHRRQIHGTTAVRPQE